jgi:hypothetical protein
MDWAKFWEFFSQTHLVTLLPWNKVLAICTNLKASTKVLEKRLMST